MPKIRMTLAAAMLSAGLGGCVGAAGISTLEYRSGPGYETERVYNSRTEADSSRGFTREACANVAHRQVDASGRIAGTGLTTCDSN
jgi:hypothetical protein